MDSNQPPPPRHELHVGSSEAPKRIQRKRTKGWRMPSGAVYVGRPTRWGNPFAVGEIVPPEMMPHVMLHMELLGNRTDAFRGMTNVRLLVPQDIVGIYELWLVEQPSLMLSLNELRGRDLACWCAPESPCHADVLLELANDGDA